MLPLSIPNHAMLANCVPRENGFKVWQRDGGTRKRRSLLVLKGTVYLGQSDAAIRSIVYGVSGKGERRRCEPARRYSVRHDGVSRLKRVRGNWTRAHSRMVRRDGRDGRVAVSTDTQTVLAISC